MLWRVSDGNELCILSGGTSGISSLAYSPDGNLLISSSITGTVKKWLVSDCSELWTKNTYLEIISLALSSEGMILATGTRDGTIKLWRVSDGNEIQMLAKNAPYIFSLAFSPDGAVLASGSTDRTIKLWQVSDWSELRTLSGHTSSVESLAFSPDGAVLASGSGDGEVKLWRVSDWSELLREGGESNLESYSWTAYRSADDHYALWLIDPDGESFLAKPGEPITHAIPSSSGIGESDDKGIPTTIEGYTRLTAILAATDKNLTQIKFGIEGEKIVQIKSPSEAVVVSAREEVVVVLPQIGHSAGVAQLAFSPNGDILASASINGEIKLWRVSDWSELSTLSGHTSGVGSLAFSPDGAILASSSDDGTIRLWGVGP
jgi:WD40 repeat protein